MSAEAAKAKGIPSLARIVAIAQAGIEPDVMGLGPIPAVELVVSSTQLPRQLQCLLIIIQLFICIHT